MKTNVLILIFFLVASSVRAQSTNLTALLQQGLLEEQANGNLDAAIADYQSLAKQFDKDRQLAATAVFRIGECYRMQGKTNEAAAQYQRVLRDFSDQTTLATLSRQNLTGLGLTVATASGAPMLSDAARQEQKNLLDQEIKLFEKQLETQQLQFKTGLANYDTVLATQEKLLELKRQLAAVDAGQLTSVQDAAPVDGEEQEILRIREMVQNSPDLINRSSGDEMRRTPLCAAASKGQLRVAGFLLANGAEIDLKSQSGFTPLQSAARAGQNAMVELLLDHNAAVDAGGETPLSEAAERGYKVVAETLLAHHADVNARDNNGYSSLDAAAASGNVAIVELLLAHDANVNIKDNQGRTALSRAACVAQNEAVVKALLEAKADPNAGELDLPLHCAIHNQDPVSAEMLLRAGANPNAKGRVDWEVRFQNAQYQPGAPITPMFLAVSTGQFPMVQLLLKFKADPNDSQPNGRPLLFGVLSDTNILEALLDAGAKVDSLETIKLFNDQTDKRTALDAAAYNQNGADAVAILLKHGANPNAQDDLGETALHWAALFQLADEKVFRLLLDYKADPNVRDNNGETPLDLVKEKSPRGPGQYSQSIVNALVDLLHQHGALDNLPDWDRIEVTTASGQSPVTTFQQSTNDWNRFALLETIFKYYVTEFKYPGQPRQPGRPFSTMPTIGIPIRPPNTIPFPDLTRVVIVRPSHDSTNATRIAVNLLNSTNGVDCMNDVPLEFGDVVEIPERDHSLGDPPVGLTVSQSGDIDNYLSGTAHLILRDQKALLHLNPVGDASTIGAVLNQKAAQDLLLSSSDLSRVKVTRHDRKTGQEHEWVLDCSNPNSQPDLWLRDGDVIDVPEKR